LIILIMLGEKYKLWSSSLYSFRVHPTQSIIYWIYFSIYWSIPWQQRVTWDWWHWWIILSSFVLLLSFTNNITFTSNR
jgi:hypothetical protein